MNLTLIYLRLIVSVSLLASVVWQVSDRLIHQVFRPGEYFAYFTIHTSLIAAVVLAVTAIRELKGLPQTKALNLARLSVSSYAIVVSVVYNALLRNSAPSPLDNGYAYPVPPNEVLHVWAPILIVLDLALTPMLVKIKFKQIFWVLLFPLAWLAFSIFRGLATNWWAYWFLDPNEPAGVTGVIAYVFGVMAFMLTAAVLSLSLNRLASGYLRESKR